MPISEIRALLVTSQEYTDQMQGAAANYHERLQSITGHILSLIEKRNELRRQVAAYREESDIFMEQARGAEDTAIHIKWALDDVAPSTPATEEAQKLADNLHEATAKLEANRNALYYRASSREAVAGDLNDAEKWLTFFTETMGTIDRASQSTMLLGATIATEINNIDRGHQ